LKKDLNFKYLQQNDDDEEQDKKKSI